ncbi:hypothetical protein LINPERHAP1_LOCUS29375 [Linum perenne]
MHDYPLAIVEHYYTRNFLRGLQPSFRVPCRTTIRKEILNMYEVERVKVNKRIDELPSLLICGLPLLKIKATCL